MIRRSAWRLVGRVLAIGADPADSHDVRAQKAFFVGIIVGVLPAGVLWGALYWALGERVAALFPWGYTLASVACIAIFSRTKNFAVLRTAELSLILVTPALLQVALGGIVASSGVILWSFLAPLGAAVFDRARAWKWYAAFLALIALSSRTGMGTTCGCASGSAPGRSSRASSAVAASCTTSGATLSTWRVVWSPTGFPTRSTSPARPAISSATTS